MLFIAFFSFTYILKTDVISGNMVYSYLILLYCDVLMQAYIEKEDNKQLNQKQH